jgi:hypothetical protein
MIDHQIDGHRRLYPLDVETATRDRRAHRREIDEQRDTREILQEHSPDDERHLRSTRGSRQPSRERFDVLIPNAPAVDMAEHGFKDDAHTGKREMLPIPNVSSRGSE